MNIDTQALWNWITEDERYYYFLKEAIENELEFMYTLVDILHDLKHKHGVKIDSAKVNGNELYIEFSKLIGNEKPGWISK